MAWLLSVVAKLVLCGACLWVAVVIYRNFRPLLAKGRTRRRSGRRAPAGACETGFVATLPYEPSPPMSSFSDTWSSVDGGSHCESGYGSEAVNDAGGGAGGD